MSRPSLRLNVGEGAEWMEMVEVVWLEPDPENHRGHPHHRHNYGLGLDFRDPSPAVPLLPLRASTNTYVGMSALALDTWTDLLALT